MQRSVEKLSAACDNFGITISTKKTEVIFQPTPGKQYTEPKITAKGTSLRQAVDKFTYLGSTLSRCVHIDDEVNRRLAKASSVFGRLRPLSASVEGSPSPPSGGSTELWF